MDPYNLLQEQLANINNTLQSSLQKISDDVTQLQRRVEQMESTNTRAAQLLNDRLEQLGAKADVMPKVYQTQLGLVETLMQGCQVQYRKLSAITQENSSSQNPLFEAAAIHASQNSHLLNGHISGDDSTTHDPTQQDVSSTDPLLNRVNSASSQQSQSQQSQQAAQAQQQQQQQQQAQAQQQQAQAQQAQQQQQQQQHHQLSNRIVPQNRVNQSPVSLSMIAPQDSRRNQPVPRFNLMPNLESDQMLQNLPSSNTTTAEDPLSSLNEVVEDESRRLWESVPFRRLNPHPKSVQEVLDEYYFGFQGQPPLKYLEKYRKDWRKGNKNLSKTFCRRFRVVVAVENGVRHYIRDYGTTESVARDRIVSELEQLRTKENGKKETMYWLFHHIPQHLKRR